MTVCSTVSPAALVALTRIDTYPVPWPAVGSVRIARQRSPVWRRTCAGCQFRPSSSETSSDTAVTVDGGARACVVAVRSRANGTPPGARPEPSNAPVTFTVGRGRYCTPDGGGADANSQTVSTRGARLVQLAVRVAETASLYRPASAGTAKSPATGCDAVPRTLPSRDSVMEPLT